MYKAEIKPQKYKKNMFTEEDKGRGTNRDIGINRYIRNR